MKNIDNPAARHYYGASLIADVKQQRQNVGTGGIAQLGERLHGMQEVSGSIPLTSTKIASIFQCFVVICRTCNNAMKFLGPHRLEA